ncbi:ArsR/SmtB family transcription factor [Motiliproteus sediminis]|uniref:ArsR/SmtB family transcription factor n=1 Tax=Motiliproteus sediminis TaxID=1468178 RepID=UPI001AEFF4D5|nr:metalloregulator ArsR/SmtB family transcription factor [Motiliproteus sediminis]
MKQNLTEDAIQARAELERRATRAEQLLRRLGNRQRLIILCLLSDTELSVGELNRQVALSQSALSQHLAQLRRAGVVATRRESQTIYYRLRDQRVLSLLTALCDLGAPAGGQIDA